MVSSGTSLAAQLLDQAEHLLTRDPRRPKQANARRAVSAAYYAVFHFLGDEAGRSFVGTGAPKRPLRAAVARALEHGSLRAACERVSAPGSSGALPAPLRGCWKGPISTDLSAFARAMVILQDARHRADYDRSSPILRDDARKSVFIAGEAMDRWSRIEAREASAFLLAALAWRNLAGR